MPKSELFDQGLHTAAPVLPGERLGLKDGHDVFLDRQLAKN